MLVIQYNYGWEYKSIIVTLETLLRIGIGIVYRQELFIWNKSITHSTFNFYWLEGLRNDARVFTAIKKELINKIIVDNRTDLGDYLYFLILDIRDIDSQTKKLVRQTRVVNEYDNRVGQGFTWERNTLQNRRELEDIV